MMVDLRVILQCMRSVGPKEGDMLKEMVGLYGNHLGNTDNYRLASAVGECSDIGPY